MHNRKAPVCASPRIADTRTPTKLPHETFEELEKF